TQVGISIRCGHRPLGISSAEGIDAHIERRRRISTQAFSSICISVSPEMLDIPLGMTFAARYAARRLDMRLAARAYYTKQQFTAILPIG
ncbi:MAG: hypothetical protein J6D87_04715, partial [Clostridia bacterium]|nr:hypothetical protein [Clostridia bacterium]